MKHPSFSPQHQHGNFSRAFTTCMDLVPTVLDQLGITLLPTADGKKSLHRGREVHPIRGKSLPPWYRDGRHADPEKGESAAVHHSSEAIGWEMKARAALRQGRWKIVHLEKRQGGAGVDDEGWELFDVEADPAERLDLAEKEPEVFERMLRLWEEYVQDVGVVWGPTAIAAGISQEETPHLWDVDFDQQRSWMQEKASEVAVIA